MRFSQQFPHPPDNFAERKHFANFELSAVTDTYSTFPLQTSLTDQSHDLNEYFKLW